MKNSENFHEVGFYAVENPRVSIYETYVKSLPQVGDCVKWESDRAGDKGAHERWYRVTGRFWRQIPEGEYWDILVVPVDPPGVGLFE